MDPYPVYAYMSYKIAHILPEKEQDDSDPPGSLSKIDPDLIMANKAIVAGCGHCVLDPSMTRVAAIPDEEG